MKTSNLNIGLLLLSVFIVLTVACKEKNTEEKPVQNEVTDVPDLPEAVLDSLKENPPEGMIWIPGGTFMQGAVA